MKEQTGQTQEERWKQTEGKRGWRVESGERYEVTESLKRNCELWSPEQIQKAAKSLEPRVSATTGTETITLATAKG